MVQGLHKTCKKLATVSWRPMFSGQCVISSRQQTTMHWHAVHIDGLAVNSIHYSTVSDSRVACKRSLSRLLLRYCIPATKYSIFTVFGELVHVLHNTLTTIYFTFCQLRRTSLHQSLLDILRGKTRKRKNY